MSDKSQIAESSVFYRCVEASSEPIMMTNLRGRIIYVNPAWSRVYGYSFDEAIGQTPRMLRSQHQSEDFYNTMWKEILDPQNGVWRGELVNQAKDGSEVPVLLTISPYKELSSESTDGYMAWAVDLREKRHLEAQILKQDRLATIGELTSGLAHEIGTPMSVIRGRAELLQLELSQDLKANRSLSIIIRQIDRISSLISSLLRLTSQKSSVELVAVDVKKCFQEVLDLFEYKLRKGKVEVSLSVPDSCLILADFERLEQVFINLIVNGIYAMEKKEGTEKRVLKLQAQASECGKKIAILIEDNGTGIPPHLKQKIFEPFFTTKPTTSGTGLGLSIVSRLVQEMNGEISLTSSEGVGAQFVLKFKMA